MSFLLEELLDQVDVCHDHAAAAVPFQSKAVHGVTRGYQYAGQFSVIEASYPSCMPSSSIILR